MINTLKELKSFIILWLTQSLSTLGSAMTNFALVIWLYSSSGSALSTAMLTVCSYAPYVVMSIFAGALSDKWNKKATMLICDSIAAACTVTVLVLLKTGNLEVWHLYILNAVNGLMNTVQQPASDVASTLLTPKEHYQKTSGMRSFSNSLVSILTPVFASAMVGLAGVESVIVFDLATFATAFLVLLLFIKIPETENEQVKSESLLQTAKDGLSYLKTNKGIWWLIMSMAAINFIASIYEAALSPMILSVANETALGIVNACIGAANFVGSIIAVFFPAPKSRIRVIFNCLLFSMSTENFFLAFGKSTFWWSFGGILGWIVIPLMNANMDVIMRSKIPTDMQGRVYSARNTLQFFTIPIGYFLGGLLVDKFFEPFMANVSSDSILVTLFGSGKGSGAALLFFVIGILGVIVCLVFRRVQYIRELE
ncbi:MAG: MFS transporter [Oscillospiraceae bacterium]|nr:MFS transporter [Oscillospiraceae bacterium]